MYRKSNGLLSKEKNPNITLNKFCIISSGHKNLPGSKITITLQQWALFKSRNWIENVNQIINQITKITKKSHSCIFLSIIIFLIFWFLLLFLFLRFLFWCLWLWGGFFLLLFLSRWGWMLRCFPTLFALFVLCGDK